LQQRPQKLLELSLETTNNTHVVKRVYDGVIDCIVRTWRNEGVVGFFKGCVPNAIRVAPNAAVTFVVYEIMMDIQR